ncbi:MAG: hypothetical protein M1133_07350 [Armatimonadetes bacterium]|nr:hypothetical protein [Armatimonadota bacterium]
MRMICLLFVLLATVPNTLPVGPRDSTDKARSMSGNVRVVVTVPRDIRPAEVELFVDDRSIGKSSLRPYKQEFDASSYPGGEHSVKAVARDLKGKEIWTAISVIRTEGSKVTEQPRGIASPEPEVDGWTLENTYTSLEHGFAIKYPEGWTCKDQTASMKPKFKNGFWIVFGAYPIDKSPVIINVRRAALGPGVDAEAFAKSNPYVRDWEKKTVKGSPAFTTTTHTQGSREIVHRAIILMDGGAWMLNCRVRGEEPRGDTARLFKQMIDSLQPGGSPK